MPEYFRRQWFNFNGSFNEVLRHSILKKGGFVCGISYASELSLLVQIKIVRFGVEVELLFSCSHPKRVALSVVTEIWVKKKRILLDMDHFFLSFFNSSLNPICFYFQMSVINLSTLLLSLKLACWTMFLTSLTRTVGMSCIMVFLYLLLCPSIYFLYASFSHYGVLFKM